MSDRHPDEAELFARVDNLLADLTGPRIALPPLGERTRLRQSAGLSARQIAGTLGCRPDDVTEWEAGTQEPLAAQRTAYARLLDGLAALQPASTPLPRQTTRTGKTGPAEQQSLFHTPVAPPAQPAPQAAARTPQPPARAPRSPAPASRPPAPLRPPARPQTGPAQALAVVDHAGTLTAHLPDTPPLPLQADDLIGLLQWALDNRLHREPLSTHDRPGDPLIVLTPPASTALGLPAALEDRRSLRLPSSHPVHEQLRRAGFRLTRRGFGPWPRIYRPVVNRQRASVQLAVMAWGALADDGWNLPPLAPDDLARLLGTYTTRVLTPRGSTAVCGQELMTALRPPTRAVPAPSGNGRVSGPNPGALHQPLDPAPPEAPDIHPLAQGRPPGQAMQEEAWDWCRRPDAQETQFPYVVGLDINLAFLSAASSLSVGLNAPPRHVTDPAFDKKIPGSWYCDLSQIPTDPRLPSPFTDTGQPPTGPAWYTTPTLEHAQTLGADIRPTEAWLRDDSGRYLDPWYKHLRNAYMRTMADLGVHEKIPQADYLAGMSRLSTADPTLLALLAAIKATAKGGLGKLREGPRDLTTPHTRWPALEKATWRPDIRAAVVAKARVTLHGKMRKAAAQTGRYPLAVLSDCVLYPAQAPTALDVVPVGPDQLGVQGAIRLGVNPGFCKEEGVQTMAWYQQQLAQQLNPARYIKNDTPGA
ncbi:telomere-associated protein Tap [Streptomyces sp. NPDC059740]|uniref:telomere-associated protein Tap n=1 Tax=Streptomyces sp. NPDC059740 TaxID=3346926 RepID=UPI0036467C30